jgi:hypothetical protein
MLICAGLGSGSHPHRLWSLWGMLKVYALKYIELGDAVAKVRRNFYDVFELGSRLSAVERDELRAALAELARVCSEMELKVPAELVKHAENDLPQTARELELLLAGVFGELKLRALLYVPLERAHYYEWDEIVSDAVKLAFPGPAEELHEAANCHALGRYTAAVFHAMRAAEIGTRKLAANLDVVVPRSIEFEDWQRLIIEIGKAVKAIGDGARRGAEREADQTFYGQASAQLQFFKDGWRVRLSHGRATYNEPKAKEAIDHVRAFFETLAERLKEE